MWISPEFKVYLIKEFQRLNAAGLTSSTRLTGLDMWMHLRVRWQKNGLMRMMQQELRQAGQVIGGRGH